ncbi:aldehyde dehydrogenase family protein [Candidatus Peregrinibacteria bacterium]|nr:aldehyde dehydrogenase family protein [Candidatus Peregrinibacteria bacterium]
MSESARTFGHYIDGNEVFEGDTVERRNPADNDQVVARFHNGTPEITDRAVDSANRAFKKWSKTTPSLRGQVLFNAAVLLNTPEWRKKFVDAMVAEIGKTAGGAAGEVAKTHNILKYMFGLPAHTRGDVINADQPGVHMYTTSEPVGVAGLVTPFNFPLAVTVWKLAAALAAGCTAVIKPSPSAPMTSALIMELFKEAMGGVDALQKANIGPGVINMVHGGPDVVSALIRNQLTQALSFTGSTPVGKELLRQAMTREGQPIDPRNFVAEMGGDNAILVLADADLDMAVSAAVTGVAIGEGQRCTATKRILVDEPVAEEFIRRFLGKIGELKVGPGTNPTSDIGPLVTPQSLDAVMAAVQQSQINGMNLLQGGTRLTDGDFARGNFMQPTILQGDWRDPDHLALRQEIFGPVAGISVVKGLDNGIKAVNDNTHSHVAAVFTRDLGKAAQFVRLAKAGMIHVNNSTLGGDAQAPFGGLGGDTSFGIQEMGPHAMDPFLRNKTVGINGSNAVLGGRAR